MRKLLSFLTFGLLVAQGIFAQGSYKPKGYFGIKGGLNFTTFKVDPKIVDLVTDYKTDWHAGLFYNIPFSNVFSIQPEAMYSIMGPHAKYEQPSPVVIDEGDLDLGYISVPILLKINAGPRIAFVLGPQASFLLSAKSKLKYGGETDIKDEVKSTDFAGVGGIEIWPAYQLMVYGRYIYGFTDINDNSSQDNKIYNRGFQVGLAWGFRKRPKAPVVTPPPPIPDSDGDGVLDPDDKCPNQPGLAKYGGCPIPDSDGDGINDEEDKCPNQPGVAQYQGCPIPDSDGDGVLDPDDKCPNEAGVAEYQGCPVPDRDNDGVPDDKDRCPDVAGVPEKDGCPDLKAEFNFEFSIVQFVTGSSKLTATAQKELNKLVNALNKYPTLGVNIDGHTDNVGKDDFNMKLSQNRANSVKSYLVKKGISADRLTASGYGEDRPIGDNATKEGRAANRRVEFSLRQ